MRPVVFSTVLALLAVIWSCGPPTHAGSRRHPLLPDAQFPVATTAAPPPTTARTRRPARERVLWGMPMVDYLPLTFCPREGYRRSWWIFGRDAALIHSLATFTHQVDGCVQVNMHDDPLGNLTNGKYHVYGHAMYWSPHMMGHVRYLYPHAQDPICFIIRRADFVKREIFSAFMVEVYIFIGVYLLMFILILRFGFQVDVLQAVTEATETFLTGTFVDSRRFLMIWGSIFSLIILNSFSGVFTSFLAVPKRGYEINTLEELTQHFDYIITSVQLRQAFLSKVDTSDHPKLFALFDNKKPLEEITNFRYPRMDSESHIKISQLEKWKSVELRQMKECMWSSAFVSFAVAKNWDLADRYDRLLMRLVQAGVVEKASADSWSNYSLYFWGRIVHGTSSHSPTFSLGHLVEAFIILCAGIGAGLLCFLAELAPSLWTRFNESFTIQTAR